MQEVTLLAASTGVGLFVEREMRRRRSSETMLEARERLVNEGFGDLVTRHDAQGAVVAAGPNAPAVLGVPGRALEGRGLFERVHVADRPAYLKALADAAAPPGAPSPAKSASAWESPRPAAPRPRPMAGSSCGRVASTRPPQATTRPSFAFCAT